MLAITPTNTKITVGFPHQPTINCTAIGSQNSLRTNPSSKLVKRPIIKPKIPAESTSFCFDPNKAAETNTPTMKLISVYPVEKIPASCNLTVPNVSQNKISPITNAIISPATLPRMRLLKSMPSNLLILSFLQNSILKIYNYIRNNTNIKLMNHLALILKIVTTDFYT